MEAHQNFCENLLTVPQTRRTRQRRLEKETSDKVHAGAEVSSRLGHYRRGSGQKIGRTR